jgi:hypothetical protein
MKMTRNGEQHLAEVLGLRGLAAVEVQAGQLGDALDQRRDLAAEALLDVFGGDRRVLHNVVKQRGAQQRGLDPRFQQIEQDQAHFHQVRDVRLARHAALTGVRLGGEVETCRDAIAVGLGGALVERGDQRGAQLGVRSACRALDQGSFTPLTLS